MRALVCAAFIFSFFLPLALASTLFLPVQPATITASPVGAKFAVSYSVEFATIGFPGASVTCYVDFNSSVLSLNVSNTAFSQSYNWTDGTEQVYVGNAVFRIPVVYNSAVPGCVLGLSSSSVVVQHIQQPIVTIGLVASQSTQAGWIVIGPTIDLRVLKDQSATPPWIPCHPGTTVDTCVVDGTMTIAGASSPVNVSFAPGDVNTYVSPAVYAQLIQANVHAVAAGAALAPPALQFALLDGQVTFSIESHVLVASVVSQDTAYAPQMGQAHYTLQPLASLPNSSVIVGTATAGLVLAKNATGNAIAVAATVRVDNLDRPGWIVVAVLPLYINTLLLLIYILGSSRYVFDDKPWRKQPLLALKAVLIVLGMWYTVVMVFGPNTGDTLPRRYNLFAQTLYTSAGAISTLVYQVLVTLQTVFASVIYAVTFVAQSSRYQFLLDTVVSNAFTNVVLVGLWACLLQGPLLLVYPAQALIGLAFVYLDWSSVYSLFTSDPARKVHPWVWVATAVYALGDSAVGIVFIVFPSISNMMVADIVTSLVSSVALGAAAAVCAAGGILTKYRAAIAKEKAE